MYFSVYIYHHLAPPKVLMTPVPRTPKKTRRIYKHLSTPTKSTIRTLNRDGYPQIVIKQKVLERHGVDLAQSTISRTCNSSSDRTRGHTPSVPETRGHQPKYSDAELDQVERLLQEHPETKWWSWNSIADEAGLPMMGGK